ncbi:MAG: hypothetical protein K6A97_01430 [Lachnospiraceae bacterium]|nr:hypothetical protein [Lachnospiraceae bacterium]
MLNLIKMNMYRLLKSKNFISLLVMIFLAFAITKVQLMVVSGVATIETSTIDENGNVVYEEIEPTKQELDSSFTVMNLFTGFGYEICSLFVSIFAIVYCENERKNGFVKNLSVTKKEKPLVFAAKLAPVAVYTVLLLISVFLGTWIATLSFKEISFGEVVPTLKFIGIETVLITAFGMFSMALYELFRKNVPAIIFGTFTAIGLTGQIVTLIQFGLNKLGLLSDSLCEKFILSDYFLSTRIGALSVSDLSGGKVSSIVIGVAGLALYIVAGMALYGKKDVV